MAEVILKPEDRPGRARPRAECTWMPIPDPEGLDLRPDPDAIATTAELLRAVRSYRIWAGNPSYQTMASRCLLSASALRLLVQRDSLPLLEQLLEFLWACGTEDEYRDRFTVAWRRVALANPAAGTRED